LHFGPQLVACPGTGEAYNAGQAEPVDPGGQVGA
jgi:hypothetical protein